MPYIDRLQKLTMSTLCAGELKNVENKTENFLKKVGKYQPSSILTIQSVVSCIMSLCTPDPLNYFRICAIYIYFTRTYIQVFAIICKVPLCMMISLRQSHIQCCTVLFTCCQVPQLSRLQ